MTMKARFIKKRSHGRRPSVGRWLSFGILAAVFAATSSGCRYDPNAHLYSKHAPPKTEICGDWSIDSIRTNWREAAPLLQHAGQAAQLSIRSDGTFSFEGMPNVSDFCEPANFHHKGSGRWWTNVDDQGVAYLWLHIDRMDGQQQDNAAGAAYFCHADGRYFLYFSVIDPDSGEVFVLKKVD